MTLINSKTINAFENIFFLHNIIIFYISLEKIINDTYIEILQIIF